MTSYKAFVDWNDHELTDEQKLLCLWCADPLSEDDLESGLDTHEQCLIDEKEV